MQVRELFINGKLMDLGENTKIGVTLQANNLAELQNRQGDFSNIFKLPKTTNNRLYLEHLDNISSVSVIPYKKNTARYLENGIEIVSEGTATVENTDHDYYYVKVVSGNVDYFDLFPDFKIFDLDWSDEVHVRNFSTILNSRTNTSGFIYPIINWYNGDNTTAFNAAEANTRYLFPCIFVKDVFTKVDELTGYTSKGSFIDWLQTNEIVLSPKDSKIGSQAVDKYNSLARNTVSNIYTFPVNSYHFVPFNADLNTNLMNNGVFTTPTSIFGYFSFRGRLAWNTGSLYAEFRIYNVQTNVTLGGGSTTWVASPLSPRSFNLVTSNINLNAGDQIAVSVRIFCIGTGVSNVAIDFRPSEFKFNLVQENPYGTTVQTGELFDLKIKDLYKDLMNWKGVQIQTNVLKKEVYFDFFNDIQTYLGGAEDWSNKVDISTIQTVYKFGKYAQNNYFKFKDTDTVLADFGDALFQISDETLPDELVVIQMITSATQSDVKFSNYLIPRIKSVNIQGAFTPTEYRLLKLNRQNVTFKYYDNANSSTVTSNVPMCNAIEFDLQNDYAVLQEMLNKTKVIKIKLKLDEVDIKKLERFDFPTKQMGYLQAIAIDIQTEKMNLNGYFYINKIENIQGGFGTAELIRV